MDIRQQVVPADDAAVGVSKREAARLEPAIFAIRSADAMLEFVRLPGLDGVLPGGRSPAAGRPDARHPLSPIV